MIKKKKKTDNQIYKKYLITLWTLKNLKHIIDLQVNKLKNYNILLKEYEYLIILILNCFKIFENCKFSFVKLKNNK